MPSFLAPSSEPGVGVYDREFVWTEEMLDEKASPADLPKGNPSAKPRQYLELFTCAA